MDIASLPLLLSSPRAATPGAAPGGTTLPGAPYRSTFEKGLAELEAPFSWSPETPISHLRPYLVSRC